MRVPRFVPEGEAYTVMEVTVAQGASVPLAHVVGRTHVVPQQKRERSLATTKLRSSPHNYMLP